MVVGTLVAAIEVLPHMTVERRHLGNATKQWLLIAVRHVVLYGVKWSMSEKEVLMPRKRIFCNQCPL